LVALAVPQQILANWVPEHPPIVSIPSAAFWAKRKSPEMFFALSNYKIDSNARVSLDSLETSQ
jgi:hypothetical protein